MRSSSDAAAPRFGGEASVVASDSDPCTGVSGDGSEPGAGVNRTLLASLVDTLDLDPTIEGTVWASLALANAMTAMASARRYAWHSVGALGASELTAPARSAGTSAALKPRDGGAFGQRCEPRTYSIVPPWARVSSSATQHVTISAGTR